MHVQSRRHPAFIRASFRMIIMLLLINPVILGLLPAHAATYWYVSPNGSDTNTCRTSADSCKTIGNVIEKSANGDTIQLTAGTYFETLTITKNLTIIGAGADATVIDGNYLGTVLTVQPPSQLYLSGMTLQNGNGSYSGGVFNNYADVTLSGIIIRNSQAFNGFGGGIYNRGILTLSKCIIEDNFAPFAGGGIYNAEGMATINESIIQNNTAAYTRSALVSSYGGGISNGGIMILNRSSVSQNASYSSTTLSSGGGIDNVGILRLNDSVISDNRTAGFGGGIISRSTLTIEGSTINGNTAGRFVPRSDGGVGGGIHNAGSASVRNSTISGNSADDTGGAIWNTGTISITNATISDNSAAMQAGGIAHAGGTLTMQNSILATNTTTASPDCSGTLTSQGYNLVGDSSGCAFLATAGDQVGSAANPIDPQLDQLRLNGGSTPTQQLLAGSPAIDAANPAQPGSGGTACLITDQRGFRRPQGQACDIGAYELGPMYFLPWLQ